LNKGIWKDEFYADFRPYAVACILYEKRKQKNTVTSHAVLLLQYVPQATAAEWRFFMTVKFFTSESVTEGHPDKICDRISDSVLDSILECDPFARVACETAVTTGMVLVMGEITTNCYVDIPKIARNAIKDIGYDNAEYGFDYKTCAVLTAIDEQSADIAMGVDKSYENKLGKQDELQYGAGDQGMMFGYACNETAELMPMPITLAHNITRELARLRKERILPYLRPDGKAQVTVQYDNGVPVRIDAIVISTQHDPDVTQKRIHDDLTENIVLKVLPAGLIDKETKIFINPTGRFVVGGPQGDSGLTGRKIIVDTYGGIGRHGGGAFSGKDATKVDRSGAYAARNVAKNIVAAKLADRCEVEIAYAIGVAEPVSVFVETFGTGITDDEKIACAVKHLFDLRPTAIIHNYDLRKPVYSRVSCYGHFGRPDLDLTWEKTNKVQELKDYFKIRT
jgi:S-adenosylmethionine synthetase